MLQGFCLPVSTSKPLVGQVWYSLTRKESAEVAAISHKKKKRWKVLPFLRSPACMNVYKCPNFTGCWLLYACFQILWVHQKLCMICQHLVLTDSRMGEDETNRKNLIIFHIITSSSFMLLLSFVCTVYWKGRKGWGYAKIGVNSLPFQSVLKGYKMDT